MASIQAESESSSTNLQFDTIDNIIASFRANEFVIILDSTTRENEGDLIIAAAAITTAQMAFMIRHTSGLICAPLSAELSTTLSLPQMVTHNTESHQTAYTVSVDADSPAVSTGISAHDRALTCRALARQGAVPGDFRRPGHVFPLRARPGGVRERQGHTEAAVALCRLAGVSEVAVISELVAEDREVLGQAERVESGMMRRDECLRFAKTWGLRIGTIEQIVEYLETHREGEKR